MNLPFTISSDAEVEREIEFLPMLTLATLDTTQKIVLGTIYDKWFTDVDFTGAAADVSAKVLSNISEFFEYYTGTYTE